MTSPPTQPPLDPEQPGEEDSGDDSVIGVAFRRSVLVIASVALLGLAGYWLKQRSRGEAPQKTIGVAAPEAVSAPAGAAPELPFQEVAAEAGLRFVHSNGAYGDKLLPETMGGGVAAFDYDGDGDDDLLFVDSGRWPHHRYAQPPSAPLALYRNDTAPGGPLRFADVTREAGLEAPFREPLYGMGVAVGDYDGDGDRDVFVTGVGRNRLLRNDGRRFTDVTGTAGVAGAAEEWSTGAAFLDVDRDGDLDLFVCNYVRWSKEIDFKLDFRLTGVGRAFGPPQNYEGSAPYLYRNEGNGRFSDISEKAGVRVVNPATSLPMAKSLAVAPVDADGDGWIDILVANDTVRKFFFHNRGAAADGGPLFEEAGELFGLAYDRNGNATGAMGVDSAYHRNDRNLAFAIGNFANEMSSLYVAQDDPQFFVDESIGEGIGAPSRLMLSFGLLFFDADLDGRLDLLQANGHIEEEIGKVDPSQAYRQPGQLFWNTGSGFELLPDGRVGDLTRKIVGRGAAYADFDGDGDLDLVLTQIAGPALLLRNDQATGHHWLRVRLAQDGTNQDAVGAWVELVAGSLTQRRQVMPTRSYLSQVEPIVTFGLGAGERVDSLGVTWPDGAKQNVPVPGVDRLLTVSRQAP
ncbi:MAG: CRTAC1 family protein [Vicinamibacteria bacterium]